MKYNSILNQWDLGSDIEDGDDHDMTDSEDETDSAHSTLLPAKEVIRGGGAMNALTRSPPQIAENQEPSSLSSPRLPSPTSELTSKGNDEEFIETNDSVSLSATSRANVISVNPIIPESQTAIPRHYIEDLVYYRYGYSLSEWPYHSIFSGWEKIKPIAGSWLGVCRAVGGQSHETMSEGNCAPIQDFLSILLESKRPFHEVPYIYWDISPTNRAPLKTKVATFNLRIEVLPFKDETLCLLHPFGLEEHLHPPWTIAVHAQTALECLRRGLGPDPYDIADFLIDHGMFFRTLQTLPLSAIQNLAPPLPCVEPYKPLLGTRPLGYIYDLADFAAYEKMRDAFIKANPAIRHALASGNLLSRFARAILPNSVIYDGPSDEALDGQLYVGRDQVGRVMVDDILTPEVCDLLCGTYLQGTSTQGV